MKRALKYLAATILVLVLLAGGIIGFREAKDYYDDWYIDTHLVRTTPFPAADAPDQIALTWSADPRTTQTVQWRTSTAIGDGSVEWRRKGSGSEEVKAAKASHTAVEDKMLKNDPVVHRFTAVLEELSPATEYEYRVGSAAAGTWSEWNSFTTAPDGPANFSFIYQGDPQLGLEEWGKLIHKAQENHSSAAFHVIAGDLVNSGSWRNEWDRFFEGGRGVFNARPVVPVLGNHDYDKKASPYLYLESFALGTNGPDGLAERAYSFEYANALFVILDSNDNLSDQTPWLEDQLAKSKAVWKFAVYHHPAYSSAPNRDNSYVRQKWAALFDKYHVDMALQGHDHAYLRTYPLNNGRRVASAKDGTYYVVSVSGTKYYEQEQHDYAEVAFEKVSTYQTIGITTNPDKLVYRCIDFGGKVRDEVVIEK
ncbi:MAG: metallophosphoesterase family protein [Candidatus Hydrogenedentes bacterium]|nr:metallophosphoesterase family protein [Candidatus Hydrogenedentota bacterium]